MNMIPIKPIRFQIVVYCQWFIFLRTVFRLRTVSIPLQNHVQVKISGPTGLVEHEIPYVCPCHISRSDFGQSCGGQSISRKQVSPLAELSYRKRYAYHGLYSLMQLNA
jgi:hypothetical protein